MSGSRFLRLLVTIAGLLSIWQLAVWASGVPVFILPGPFNVGVALTERISLISDHALITGVEIMLGFLIGALLGLCSAVSMGYSLTIRRWLLPVLVISQAIPVFALAPVLTLWLGYGMESKIAMAILIIFFPVAAAGYDGLRRTDPQWVDLSRVMGASRWAELRHVRLPASLPALGSGLRVAAAVAPIGAVVGEWIGSSAGLGYLMLHANARVQIDLMFAALFVLAVIACAFYFFVDAIVGRLTPWQTEFQIREDNT